MRHRASCHGAIGELLCTPAEHVREALNDRTEPRLGPSGRPEDGPYPGDLSEVADEVVAWIDELSPSGRLAELVLERLGMPSAGDDSEPFPDEPWDDPFQLGQEVFDDRA